MFSFALDSYPLGQGGSVAVLDKQQIQLPRREFGMPSLEALTGEVDHGFRQHESAADAVGDARLSEQGDLQVLDFLRRIGEAPPLFANRTLSHRNIISGGEAAGKFLPYLDPHTVRIFPKTSAFRRVLAVCIYLLDAGAPVSEVEFGQLLKHFPRVLEAYRADRFDKFYPIVYNYRNYETNL